MNFSERWQTNAQKYTCPRGMKFTRIKIHFVGIEKTFFINNVRKGKYE
jgi:hypothetical protein